MKKPRTARPFTPHPGKNSGMAGLFNISQTILKHFRNIIPVVYRQSMKTKP